MAQRKLLSIQKNKHKIRHSQVTNFGDKNYKANFWYEITYDGKKSSKSIFMTWVQFNTWTFALQIYLYQIYKILSVMEDL